jgi:hypothetical protein
MPQMTPRGKPDGQGSSRRPLKSTGNGKSNGEQQPQKRRRSHNGRAGQYRRPTTAFGYTVGTLLSERLTSAAGSIPDGVAKLSIRAASRAQTTR